MASIVGASLASVLVLVLAGSVGASPSYSPKIFVAFGSGGAAALGSADPDGANATTTGSNPLGAFVNNGPGPNNITAVATDGNYVYFSDITTNTIGRVDTDGSNLNVNFITGAAEPNGVVVEGNHIYWANTNNSSNATIGRADLDGSNVDQSFITGAGAPFGMAANAQHLYWANEAGNGGLGTVARADIDGSNVDQAFITPSSYPVVHGVAVDAHYIYYAQYNLAEIGRADLDGSNQNDSFINGPYASLVSPTSVAVDGGHVYWTSGDNVERANFDGSSVGTVFSGAPYFLSQGVAVLNVPSAPTNVVATPGSGSASVAFDVPPANGSSITGYTVTSSPGGITGSGSASPIAVSGLTNGTSYTFTVTATSAVGTSAASDPSNAVVPSNLPVITSFSPTTAAAGAQVTIKGTGLDTVTEVDFTGSGAPATIFSQNATKLVTIVPADATLGPITLHNSVGSASTADFKPIPKITSLGAYDGAPDNLVAINGTNLAQPSAVKFGTIGVTPDTVTATEIDARVPLTDFSSGKVSVTTPGGTATSALPYAITKITSVAPASAAAGKTITITGQGLGSTTHVEFVNHSAADIAPVVPPTATTVKVVVPDDAAVGDVFVDTPNVPAPVASPRSFTPLPTITSIDPPDGEFGTTVHIFGANLVDASLVKFGRLDGDNFGRDSATEVHADVPTGFTGGKVSVLTGAGTAISKTSFAITKVTGFSPLAASYNKTVTVTGQGLSDVSEVDFGSVPGTIVSRAATAVKVLVPDDAYAAPLIVKTPAVPGGLPMTSATFKPLPTITSVSPVDGQAATDTPGTGTPVTITGHNFYSSPSGVTTVKFGTIEEPLLIRPDSEHIVANIPEGFSSGKITVSTDSGTATSTTTVSVTKVTSISPTKGLAGQTVTITGQGLGSVTGVNFTGPIFTLPPFPPSAFPVPATVLSVTPTAIKVQVPTLATDGPLTIFSPRTPITGIQTAQSFTPLPSLTSIDPTPSQAGGLVIVGGANLEPDGNAPTVTLGGNPITPAIASSTTLLLALPDDAITGETLTVATPNGSASLKLKVEPTISGDPSPTHATAGTPVTLTGKTFTGTTKVTFGGGVSVPFKLAGALGSDQTLTFNVPATAKSGAITVTNAGGSADSTTFTVDPAITSFTPASGPVGATLTVKGTGFDGATVVKFGGGVTSPATNVTTTSLKVAVPQGVDAGTLVVHTASAGDSAPSSATFTPTVTISSISPLGGKVGTPVEINGAGFTGVTDVKFGSVSVGTDFTVVNSGTRIDTHVPDGATDAVITVVRSVAPTTLTSAASFSVLSVTSLSATDVHEGDTLTINGTHLGNATGVSFTGVGGSVTPSNVSDSSLDVVVPAGASNGPLTVSTSDFGDVTAPSITIDPPQIDSISFTGYSPSGSLLQIDGAGFAGLESVDIGGIDVTSDEFSATASRITILLPGGFAFDAAGTSGDVVVHTDAGDTSGGPFTVYQHANGLGSNYFDTTAPGSYSEAQAQEAANLWGAGSPVDTSCSGGSAVALDNGGSVVTFVWDGGADATLLGRVLVAPTQTCPTSGDPAWPN